MFYDKKYEGLSDEELVNIIQSNDDDAMEYLLNKYKNLVRKKARALFIIGGDNDDLIQEGMIGLYKAIRDYNREKESKFFNFADLCITRQIYSAIKASQRKKHKPLNTYISFYSPAFSDNEEQSSLVNSLFVSNGQNPEELIIDKENTNRIEHELEKQLSRFEKEVFKMYLNGFGYIQIAEALEKEPKSIDNALQRIKGKLNVVLKSI